MFIYKQWEDFCKKLDDEGLNSIAAASALKEKNDKSFLILKHDVETNLLKSLRLAEIESMYSHRGSYYVQAYLLGDERNISILKKIQDLGHEVSYHHDVMDSNKGDLDKAKVEFQKNVALFEKYGFTVKTVCQHGNPVIERAGYTSNRDFFRDKEVQESFSSISEIMVNYKQRINNDFKYISDVGYGWKVIYDPETNDVVDSSDKDIPIQDLNRVIEYIKKNKFVIISTHPHRWNRNMLSAKVKNTTFKLIKIIVKGLLRIPIMKKLMGKFYYLAKKI
ncbi:MAG TPA: hypothetical protein VEF53_06505 [Patescibacteria group bacterium]|nr:hypothetical protein [Patescibacteria group bacterium]